MANNDIIVSEMTSATQINTGDLMIMTQPDLQSETGYSTKKGTVLQVANKMLKGTEYTTDLPDFTDKTVLGGLEELKGDLTSLLPVDTASGAIANFETDLALDLVSVLANITATQASGTPTPSTPIPINGYTEANITRCGVNLFDKDNANVVDGYISSSAFSDSNTKAKTIYIPIAPNTTYTVSKTAGVRFAIAVSNVIPTNGATYTTRQQDNTASNITITASATDRYLWAWVFLEDSDTGTLAEMLASVQIEKGTPATTYHAYNGNTYTISFGQTVYGGVLDLTTGVLTVTHFGEVFDGSNDENWGLQSINSYNIANFYIKLDKVWTQAELSICDRFTVQTTLISATTTEGYLLSVPDTFYLRVNSSRASTTAELKTWLESNNVKIVYKLATPFDIDLTPTQINAIVGTNNIYNDTNGDTEVKYKEGIQHYIDKKIAATQALIL